jgi:hypothetical protein
MNLSSNVKVTLCSPSAAVGTASITGTTLDMSGFDGVMLILASGAVTDGAPGVEATSNPTSSTGAGAQALLGALASSAANEVAVLDLYRPTDRYVTPVIVRGGSTGSVVNGLVAIQYMAGFKPTTQDAATVANTTLVISPVYGTA